MVKEVQVEFGNCPDHRTPDRCNFEDIRLKKPTEEDKSLVWGNLYFGEHRSDVRHIPFISTHYHKSSHDIISKIYYDWNLSFPRIVLFVIATSNGVVSKHRRRLKVLTIKGIIDALKTTEMWLCLNGIYNEFSKDLSVALNNEKCKKEVLAKSSFQSRNMSIPETAVIGICRQESVSFCDKLGDSVESKEPEIEKKESEIENRCNIEDNYDYFMFVKDNTRKKRGTNLFCLNLAMALRQTIPTGQGDDEDNIDSSSEIPVMVILFQGEALDIDVVRGYLKNRVPVVIIEGSGGLADLLAFAHAQFSFRPQRSNLAEFSETVLKPQLLDRILRYSLESREEEFSEKDLCEKLCDCIRYSKQGEQEFITLLSLADLVGESSSHFPQHLLRALFKAKTFEVISDRCMKRDIYLTMDWNSPDVAKTMVFAKDPNNKFRVDNETFFRALCKPHREKFISLFLNHGFFVHEFLGAKALMDLFTDSLKKEFFRTVIWENILGFGANLELSSEFLDKKLVLLLEEITGIPNLINTYEQDCLQHKFDRKFCIQKSERKAIAVLTLWGIMSYKVTLVKILIQHSEQPIQLSLVCSMILNRLSYYASDFNLKEEMKAHSIEFSKMASTLLTMCYEKFPSRALDVLSDRNWVWKNIPIIKMAAFSNNKNFIAQPCCQKLLDSIFMGYIKIRELPYGDMTFPTWVKIVLSSFLIFPMYLWIEFEVPEKCDGEHGKTHPHARPSITSKPSDYNLHVTRKRRFEEPNFSHKMYYFFTAPIVKFWISQVFYVLFLMVFSAAVLWPACGSLYLDFISCIWVSCLALDSIIYVVISFRNSSYNLFYKYVEISLMLLFVLFYLGSRIFKINILLSPYHAKVMLCLALLFFYYRLIIRACPISPSLGPMLHRIKLMTLVDFTNFMKITGLVIISNGIVMQTITYPDFPFGEELFRQAFHNALVSMFLAPDDHMGSPDMTCVLLKRHPNGISFYGLPETTCKVGRYYEAKCPNPGIWPMIFGFQYFITLKLIFMILLYALFSNTHMKLQKEGTQIWMFQRYHLVMKYSEIHIFKAPFSPIILVYWLLRYLFGSSQVHSKEDSTFKEPPETDYFHWKSLALQYSQNQQKEKEKAGFTKWRMEKVLTLREALKVQNKAMDDLSSSLSCLRVQIRESSKYLASNVIQLSLMERLRIQNVPQIFSRISPYPRTKIMRLPVSDNHVSWDTPSKQYAPIAFTLSTDDFPPDLKEYVDFEIRKGGRRPVLQWNSAYLSPSGYYCNRETWIKTKQGKIEYHLDEENLPLNPIGRTGLRGRGHLPRWGPNHQIFVIVTRWQDLIEPQGFLEVVLCSHQPEASLPGGFTFVENIYETIQQLLDNDGTPWADDNDMIAFFQSLVPPQSEDSDPIQICLPFSGLRKSAIDRSVSAAIDTPVAYERLLRGYMDEAINTDQAWCEVEAWHFHYNVPCIINSCFKENMSWMQLNEDSLEKVLPGQAGLLYLVARKMNAVLEVM